MGLGMGLNGGLTGTFEIAGCGDKNLAGVWLFLCLVPLS
jgi:hypothetical protein